MPNTTSRRTCRCGHVLEYSVRRALPRRCPACLTPYRQAAPGHQLALFDTELHTDNETLRSRAAWLAQDNEDLTRHVQEAKTRITDLQADLTRARELISLLGRAAPRAGRLDTSALERALTEVIGVVHPDKWQQGASATDLAAEVTRQLLELRSRLKEG